jgi:hypothetical protein
MMKADPRIENGALKYGMIPRTLFCVLLYRGEALEFDIIIFKLCCRTVKEHQANFIVEMFAHAADR